MTSEGPSTLGILSLHALEGPLRLLLLFLPFAQGVHVGVVSLPMAETMVPERPPATYLLRSPAQF